MELQICLRRVVDLWTLWNPPAPSLPRVLDSLVSLALFVLSLIAFETQQHVSDAVQTIVQQ